MDRDEQPRSVYEQIHETLENKPSVAATTPCRMSGGARRSAVGPVLPRRGGSPRVFRSSSWDQIGGPLRHAGRWPAYLRPLRGSATRAAVARLATRDPGMKKRGRSRAIRGTWRSVDATIGAAPAHAIWPADAAGGNTRPSICGLAVVAAGSRQTSWATLKSRAHADVVGTHRAGAVAGDVDTRIRLCQARQPASVPLMEAIQQCLTAGDGGSGRF